MNIRINDKILRSVMNLKKLDDKEKDKLITLILGKDYTLNEIMSPVNTEVKNKINKDMAKAEFLNNLYSALTGGARMSKGTTIEIACEGEERHLSFFKRIIHAVLPFAYRQEAEAIERENREYQGFLQTARGNAQIQNDYSAYPDKKDNEETRAPYMDSDLSDLEEKDELNSSMVAVKDLDIEGEAPLKEEIKTSNTSSKDITLNNISKEINHIEDTSNDEELARRLQMEEASKIMSSSDRDSLKTQILAQGGGNEDDEIDFSHFDNMTKGEMLETLKGINLIFQDPYIEDLIRNPNDDAQIEYTLYNTTKDNPELKAKMKAFNYRKCDHKKDDLEDYTLELASRRVNLPVNDDTVEIITLASYNFKDLMAVHDFIKNKPDYEYLNKALDYKLNMLSDETMIETTYNDKVVRVPRYQAFILTNSEAGNYSAVAQSITMGYTSHERLSSNPAIVKNDPDKVQRIKTLDKVKSLAKAKPQVRKNLVHKTSNSVFIDLGPQEHQTSGNGCWSCSLSTILKFQGVDITQEEIRGFKPKGYSDMDKEDIQLARLKDRMSFTVRSSNDMVNTVLDYTELIHKSVPDAVMHQMDVNPGNFKNRITNILNTYKTPVSFTNGSHYTTIVGMEGDYIIYRDSISTNPPYHAANVDPAISDKYKNYCVQKIDSYCTRKSEISFIEKIEDPNRFKNYISSFQVKEKASVSGDTLFMSRTIGPKDEELISIPENLAKTMEIGPFDKKPEMEDFRDDEMNKDDDFTLLNK